MPNRVLAPAFGVVFALAPVILRAQAPEIGHQPIGCVVAGHYPLMTACFTPTSEVARARVYFHAEGVREWYYVEMKPAPPCYAAALLRPSKKLAEQKKRLEYYVEVTSRAMEVGRTQQFDPLVVASADECRKDLPVAPFAPAGPAAVFPSVPAGFAGAGFPGAAIVGAGVAVAGGTGALLAGGGGGSTTTPTTAPPAAVVPTSPLPQPFPSPTATPTPAPGPTPAPTPTPDAPGPTPGPTPTPGSPGPPTPVPTPTPEPTPTPTPGPTPTPTPTPAPTPTPPVTFKLTLTKPLLPAGTGAVKDNKGQLTCGTLCRGASATYPSGTNIVLQANPDPLSGFAGWGGDCSGTTPTCSFKMDANKDVTASFSLLGLVASPPASAEALDWVVQLDVPGAVGQVVVNGHSVRTSRGPTQASVPATEGDNVLEAQLVEGGDRPGTWRFEARDGEAIAPGSLRVMRGEVALVTPTAVVFRLKGKRGEEVAFSYRLRR